MYRQYISQADYDRIVSGVGTEKYTITAPHCNSSTFHVPGICPYCDAYYLKHPGFVPVEYATREANGWGGNMAPIIDDERAANEQRLWNEQWLWEANLALGDQVYDTGKKFSPWRTVWEWIKLLKN